MVRYPDVDLDPDAKRSTTKPERYPDAKTFPGRSLIRGDLQLRSVEATWKIRTRPYVRMCRTEWSLQSSFTVGDIYKLIGGQSQILSFILHRGHRQTHLRNDCKAVITIDLYRAGM